MFNTVVRTPSASPIRPCGAECWMRDMRLGCEAPSPSPSMKAMVAMRGTVRTSGKSAYATQATKSVTVTSRHSGSRRANQGSAMRTTKVAAANDPRMPPIVDAERPIEVP